MEQEKLNITLRIGEKAFPMKINREDEEKFRLAAKLAQEKYMKYSSAYDIKASEDIMAMVILDLAKNYIDLSEKKENYSLMVELSDIVDTLGEYIKAQ